MKTTIKQGDECPFTQIPNWLIQAKELKPLDRMLYCILRSKPANWVFYRSQICEEYGISENCYTDGIKRLAEFGAIKTEELRDELKRFCGVSISVFNIRQRAEQLFLPHGKSSVTADFTTTNTDTYNTNTDNTMSPSAPKRLGIKTRPAAAKQPVARWQDLAYADAAFIDAFNSTSKREGCKYDWEAWLAIPAAIDKRALSAAFIAKCKATKEPKYQPQLRKFIESYVFDAKNPRNNTSKAGNSPFGSTTTTPVASPADKRLLSASSKFQNISKDWLKMAISTSKNEEVLAEINNRWSDYGKMDYQSAINEASLQVQKRYTSNIFSEMLKNGVDNDKNL